MAKTVVRIEIGESKTRAAVLSMGKKKQHIKKAVVFDTPKNAMEDGYIRDHSMFAEQLLLKLREAGIKAKDLVFAISSNKVISREVTVSAAKEKMLKSIVLSEVDEYFPMDLSEHIISYSIIGHDVENGQFRLMVYAAPEALIYGYYGVAREMRCNVAAIDFTGNAVFQWMKRSALEEVSLIMEVNETSSVITILNKDEMGVQRTINYGASTLADALAESGSYDGLDTPAKAMNLLLSQDFINVGPDGEEKWREAELARIREGRFQRIETGSTENENGESMEAERSVERLLSDEEILKRRAFAREDVTEAARLLVSNMRRVMDYYTSKNGGVTVQKVYVTGLGAMLQGLDGIVAQELDLAAEVYDITESVAFSGEASAYADRGQEFLACCGAVISPLGFRPADADAAEKKKELAILSAIIFVAAAASIGFLVLSTQFEINSLEKRQEELKAQIAEAESIEQLRDVYLASQQSVQLMEATDALTFREPEQLNELISEMERALPKRAVVHDMTISGNVMTIGFSTITKEEAAKVQMQLKEIPYIQSATMSGIVEKVDEATKRTEVTFTVNCVLQKYDPKAAAEAEAN